MLKPCPFCGKHPTLIRRRCISHGPVLFAYACWNLQCPVKVTLKYEYDTAEAAAEVWNRRYEE